MEGKGREDATRFPVVINDRQAVLVGQSNEGVSSASAGLSLCTTYREVGYNAGRKKAAPCLSARIKLESFLANFV